MRVGMMMNVVSRKRRVRGMRVVVGRLRGGVRKGLRVFILWFC